MKKPNPTLVRTSERSTFKRCRWQWARAYVDHLQPVRERPALRLGTLLHKALELRYPPGIKRGPLPAVTFERLYTEQLNEVEKVWGFRLDEDEEWVSALDLGVDMLEQFVEKYGRDEEWKVLGSEVTFKVPVLGPDGKVLFNYVGTMDNVLENRVSGGVCIHDWKSTSSDPTKLSHLILDEQASAYWTFGVDWLIENRILKPKHLESLDGMLYTFLRKGKRDGRPQHAVTGEYLNADGSISKRQPPPFFHRELVYRSEAEREATRQRAIAEFFEMKACREGDMEIYKTPGGAINSHCNWCAFNDVCELHEADADWEGLRDATMTEWDPYAAHEIAEEGKG